MSYKPGETNWFTHPEFHWKEEEHRKPWIKGGSALLAEAAAIIALLPQEPTFILDAGCAGGHLTHMLAFHGHTVVGLDVCDAVITANREKDVRWNGMRSGALFHCGDFDGLPHGIMYGAIVFASALHHSVDIDATMRSCYEGLKPGGIFIANEPGRGHESSSEGKKHAEMFNVTERSTPPSRIIKAGRKAGFINPKIYPNAISLHKAAYCPGDFAMYHPRLAKVAGWLGPIMFILGKRFHGLTTMHKP